MPEITPPVEPQVDTPETTETPVETQTVEQSTPEQSSEATNKTSEVMENDTPVETPQPLATPEAPVSPTNVPNPVEVQNQLSIVLQAVEGVMSRVQDLKKVGADVVDLADKFHEVRSLIADKLGLIENEAGDLIKKL